MKKEKLTNFDWVNLYQRGPWIFASRKDEEITKPDAVVIVPCLHGETVMDTKVVMTKEFRYPINDVEYGFPAGLVDEGETVEEAVARELKEETGLDMKAILDQSPMIFSSAGITDEAVAIVFVVCTGELSTEYQERQEIIEPVTFKLEELQKLIRNKDYKFGAKAWTILWAIASSYKMTIENALLKNQIKRMQEEELEKYDGIYC